MNFDALTQTQWYAFGALMAAALEFGYGLFKLRSADAMTRVVARLTLWMGASALAAAIILYFVSDVTTSITAALLVAAGLLGFGVMRVMPEMKAIGKPTP